MYGNLNDTIGIHHGVNSPERGDEALKRKLPLFICQPKTASSQPPQQHVSYLCPIYLCLSHSGFNFPSSVRPSYAIRILWLMLLVVEMSSCRWGHLRKSLVSHAPKILINHLIIKLELTELISDLVSGVFSYTENFQSASIGCSLHLHMIQYNLQIPLWKL